MDMIGRSAAYDSARRYATWETPVNVSNHKIYSLGQCTPDLSGDQCYLCLQGVFKVIPVFVYKQGLRVIGVRCNFMFELYPFYGDSILSLSAPSPRPKYRITQEGNKNHAGVVIVYVVLLFIASMVLLSIVYVIFWRQTNKKLVFLPEIEDETLLTSAESKLFDLNTLREATNNFSDANMLGEGGFGPVYKGALKDGQEIAVKRLSRTSDQGLLELRNEVVFVAKLQHRNLIRLLGCCLEEKEKLLVYEYLPDTSLDKILFDPYRSQVLEWCLRYKIIEGISRGLLYLHEDSRLRIIHRDLKASYNILLDKDMNPKISNFGLAKHFGANETHKKTTRIAGTYGYMAPEYAIRGVFSTKSDVFSYGVLALEIVTGSKNSDFQKSNPPTNLISHVWQQWNEGNALELADQTLGDRFIKEQVLRCIHIGLLCVQQDPTNRPSMASIVNMLSNHSIPLPTSTAPAFFISPDLVLDFVTEEDADGYNTQMISENEVTITEIGPR
ncbi:Non-specific serine/threonine protein kinase protein [Dioscorea alata]|uniref:Non-specific serine/threonine protein kinase protein n=1 Tax=Dioscorea alata TaxID=55571 RepID=A0ACB7VR05_DIOAL|nr:Non-specific serine/threonine protein kinase protein [Dioscorea alata]